MLFLLSWSLQPLWSAPRLHPNPAQQCFPSSQMTPPPPPPHQHSTHMWRLCPRLLQRQIQKKLNKTDWCLLPVECHKFRSAVSLSKRFLPASWNQTNSFHFILAAKAPPPTRSLGHLIHHHLCVRVLLHPRPPCMDRFCSLPRCMYSICPSWCFQ